jgi:hypothetical protein
MLLSFLELLLRSTNACYLLLICGWLHMLWKNGAVIIFININKRNDIHTTYFIQNTYNFIGG